MPHRSNSPDLLPVAPSIPKAVNITNSNVTLVWTRIGSGGGGDGGPLQDKLWNNPVSGYMVEFYSPDEKKGWVRAVRVPGTTATVSYETTNRPYSNQTLINLKLVPDHKSLAVDFVHLCGPGGKRLRLLGPLAAVQRDPDPLRRRWRHHAGRAGSRPDGAQREGKRQQTRDARRQRKFPINFAGKLTESSPLPVDPKVEAVSKPSPWEGGMWIEVNILSHFTNSNIPMCVCVCGTYLEGW